MSYYIGIDLGTSSVKMIIADECGRIIRTVSREYPLYFPHEGWSEQDPQNWYNAVMDGLKELAAESETALVRGISFGGQMHGLIMLDENDRVIRPAILWNDGRSDRECEYLNKEVGRERLSSYTANIAFAGFTAPKILWVKENEPENFKRIKKIMLPKDYIAYMLTGVHATDYSDASGMLLLDVKNKKWSEEMLDICGIDESVMPQLFESWEPVGTLKPEIARELGFGADTKVIAGAGDNAAAAIAAGTVRHGQCNISLGTSGTVFISQDDFSVDSQNALHSFAHANGRYHLMGCILSAASCNKWWLEDILKTQDYAGSQADIRKLGENSVFFLPYLMGERSPHNDPNLRGAFLGMSLDTSQSDMTQAVLEGVAFALRDSIEVARGQGIKIDRSTICGGGAKSPLWCNIIANVTNTQIVTLQEEVGPSMGGAILAMVGCGEYRDVFEAADKLVKTDRVYVPDPVISDKYNEKYEKFRKMYPSVKEMCDIMR